MGPALFGPSMCEPMSVQPLTTSTWKVRSGPIGTGFLNKYIKIRKNIVNNRISIFFITNNQSCKFISDLIGSRVFISHRTNYVFKEYFTQIFILFT